VKTFLLIPLSLACLPLCAQPAPTAPRAPILACATKGCPEKDQHGQAPKSCIYQSGMATGFKCVLLCTYPSSRWGTFVASSLCN
jgi:hypothetical protein